MQLTSVLIGKSYDDLNALFTIAFGSHIHNGYWYSPEDHSPLEVALQRMNDLIIEKLAAHRDWSVLDVGCGGGAIMRQLATRVGCQTLGISNSHVQIDAANAQARAVGIDQLAKFQFADANSLPFPDAHFDGALTIESLCHMGNRPRVLRELARVLRPGGRIVVVDFAQSSAPLSQAEKDFLDDNELDFLLFDEIGDLFRGAGFEVLESVDLSWTTVMSQDAMLESVRQRRAELLAHYTDDFIDAFEANWLQLTDVFEKHVSYLLLVVQKPIDG